VLHGLQAKQRAAAAAGKRLAAADAKGAAAAAPSDARESAVVARLKNIAAADEAKARALKKQVEEGSISAGLAALGKAVSVRAQEQHEQTGSKSRHAASVGLGRADSGSALKGEIAKGAMVPPFTLGELQQAGQLQEQVSTEQGDDTAPGAAPQHAGSLDASADEALAAFGKGVAAQQVRGAEMAAGVAAKLRADFEAGSVSGRALSADRQLASRLALEVQAQLKGLKGNAKLQLEHKLKTVEDGLGK